MPSHFKLVKESGQYLLVGEGINYDVTYLIEREYAARKEIDKRLASYSDEVSNAATSRAAEADTKFLTLRKHVVILLGMSKSVVQAWRVGDTQLLHKHVLRLDEQLEHVKHWLQQLNMP